MADINNVIAFFIDYGEKSGEPMTNMRLNKMLYFAQGIHLAKTGARLLSQNFRAWPYGPVVAGVYEEYSRFSNAPIKNDKLQVMRDEFTDDEYMALIDTTITYGDFTTSALMTKSHRPGGAWSRVNRNARAIIPVEYIKEEFERFTEWKDAEIVIDPSLIIEPQRGEDGIILISHDDDDYDDCWPEYYEA